MTEHNTHLYALDFDGVLCDSAIETGMTGWKVAQKIWSDMPSSVPIDMLDAFRMVRPAMETGYEAILIMRLLFQGVSTSHLLTHFAQEIDELINSENLSTATLKQQFGETRDNWINNNLDGWIEMNPLFDGIGEKLRDINVEQAYIITTKQERFVQKIFQANNIHFPADHIFGLDRKMSKTQILSNLQVNHNNQTLLFVEDRLPTLINVINDQNLQKVKLYFADWGYNTGQDKQNALKLKSVSTINLANFINL